jgi:hypothetical protein
MDFDLCKKKKKLNKQPHLSNQLRTNFSCYQLIRPSDMKPKCKNSQNRSLAENEFQPKAQSTGQLEQVSVFYKRPRNMKPPCI